MAFWLAVPHSLSLLPAGSFRLYIHDAFGLAFLYDPILLESPEATYVVEWSEAAGARTTKTYITEAREKHAELHTFIYAPRKNGWQYLGQQRWSLVDIRSIWNSLIVPVRCSPFSYAETRRLMFARLNAHLQRVAPKTLTSQK